MFIFFAPPKEMNELFDEQRKTKELKGMAQRPHSYTIR